MLKFLLRGGKFLFGGGKFAVADFRDLRQVSAAFEDQRALEPRRGGKRLQALRGGGGAECPAEVAGADVGSVKVGADIVSSRLAIMFVGDVRTLVGSGRRTGTYD